MTDSGLLAETWSVASRGGVRVKRVIAETLSEISLRFDSGGRGRSGKFAMAMGEERM